MFPSLTSISKSLTHSQPFILVLNASQNRFKIALNLNIHVYIYIYTVYLYQINKNLERSFVPIHWWPADMEMF